MTDRERAEKIVSDHPYQMDDNGDMWYDRDTVIKIACEFRNEELREERRFNNFLREEFLLNTQNYPEEYHKLFQDKYERAQKGFDEYLKTKE